VFDGCSDEPTYEIDIHAHTLDIPLADIMAGSMQIYVLGGGHMHNITLSAADFALLNATGEVTVTSTSTLMHMHQVTISCT
jgi:hypothetical protein